MQFEKRIDQAASSLFELQKKKSSNLSIFRNWVKASCLKKELLYSLEEVKLERYIFLIYSHLSNKRGDTLIAFDFFPPSMFNDFLDFFHPPLLVYCSYELVFPKKSQPPCLFQPPHLLTQELLHPLHVYSSLLSYLRDESTQNRFKLSF